MVKKVAYPDQTLLGFLESLGRSGSKDAIVDYGATNGSERIAYKQLSERIFTRARALVLEGVSSGDRIGLAASPSIETIVTALAVIRSGAVLMPIDRQIDRESLIHIIRDGAPRMVFAGENDRERFEDAGRKQRLRVRNFEQIADSNESDIELPDLGPGEQAVLFYTSGTTGPPKGVPLTNRNISFQLAAVQKARLVNSADRVLMPLPFHHVYPLVIGTLVPLAMGLTIVLPASVTGPELVRAIKGGRVSVIIGVPRLYRALYEGIVRRIGGRSGLSALVGRGALTIATAFRRRFGLRAGKLLLRPLHKRLGPRLRVLACGGAAIEADLFMRLEALGWKVAVGYGLTETAPLLTINPPGKAKSASAGKTVAGVSLRIDPSSAPSSNDRAGEVQARGPNVFAGYRNLPNESKQSFTEDKWFKTGDLGYFDDQGYLYITGRASTVIVTENGENIQPDEVEAHYDKHRFIKEMGIVERNRSLVAVVVPKVATIAGENLSADTAIQQAIDQQNRELASYKRIGNYVVSRKELPRTQLGKIRRRKLGELYDTLKEKKSAGAEAPRGPISIDEMAPKDRELLDAASARDVWQLLADRYPKQPLTLDVSPQLDLGIDSLGWLEITLEIRDRTGVEIDEEAIGRIETVRDLIEETVRRAESGERRGLDPFENPERALDPGHRKWLTRPNWFLRILRHGLYGLNWLLVHALFRLSVRGKENLTNAPQCIIAPNHASYLDSFVLSAIIPYRILVRTTWAAGVNITFANPFTRMIARLAGAVPVRHGLSARSDMAVVVAALDRKRNLFWYPEGKLEREDAFLPFQPGIGLLLRHRPVPVVPVIIEGTRKALPLGRWWIRPGRITVTFGSPITPDKLREKCGTHEKIPRREQAVCGLRAVMEELRR